MDFFSLPLNLSPKGFAREASETESIDANVAQLIATPLYSCVIDPHYGFVLNNMRFEMLSENEGVIHPGNMEDMPAEIRELYSKKLSGSSKNEDTFAYELMKSIMENDNRLDDVNVTMTYVRDERAIYVSIKAVLKSDGSPYRFKTAVKVWN